MGSLSSSMVVMITDMSSSLTSSMGSLSSSMVSVMATTGSNLFKGNQTISGSIIPAVDNTYDLGSATHQFRDLYLSSASLYIDGVKVLGSTAQELQITTDGGQSFKILEAGSDTITLQSADGNITLASSGGGDVILDPTTGIIALKGTTTVYAGNRILSSDGNAIHFGNSVTMTGSLIVTGFIETQELRTTYISSSILYRSGSTKFGDELTDTHAFTGSLLVSGSISVPGSGLVSGSSQITYSGLSGVPSGVISGSAQVDVMSTTNIARLATTGSNTFTSNQIVSGSFTTTGNIKTDGVVNWNGTVGALSYGGGVVTMETNTATPILIKTNGTTAVTFSTGQTATFASTIASLGGAIQTYNQTSGYGVGFYFPGSTTPSIFADNVLRIYQRVEIWGGGGGYYLDVRNSSGDQKIKFDGNGGNSFLNSGNFNIGYSSDQGAKLYVQANQASYAAYFEQVGGATSSYGGVRITTNSTGVNSLYIDNAGTERFSVKGSGVVHIQNALGIGYSDPQYTLQVNGSIGLRANSQNIKAITGTGWGYSPSSYKVVMLGDTGNNVTVSINYDPSGNANGAFSGTGSEVLFRNGVSFATPTSANTAFHLNTLVMKDGKTGFGIGDPVRNVHIVSASEQLRLSYDTSGTVYTDFRNDSAGGLLINTTGGYMINYIGGSEKTRLNNTGLGVGTNDPTSRLHVYTTTADDNGGTIKYENGNTGTGGVTNAQIIGKSKYGTVQMLVWDSFGTRIGMRSITNGGSGNIYFTTGNDNVSMQLIGNNLTVTGTITENSSIRYKDNIEPIKYGLDKVLQMRGVTYTRKDNGNVEAGVIAEEINEITPLVVLKNEEGVVDSISYGRINAYLIEAVKELKKEIEELKLNR